jgi:hypothetical protein
VPLAINLQKISYSAVCCASYLQCPRSASGQPVIFDQVGMLSLSAVPWRQNLLVMLLGLYCYETAQTLLQKKAAKGKAAGGAKQQVRAARSSLREGVAPLPVWRVQWDML